MFESRTRKFALLFWNIAFAALCSGPALAAAPTFNWTGVYVGVNAGLSAGNFNEVWADSSGPYSYDSARSNGFSGGGQAGLNFRPGASNFVLGVEGDVQGSTLDGTYADYGTALHFGTSVNWWATARGRVGYSVGNILPFVTGGFAFGQITNDYYDQSLSLNTKWSNSRSGWTAGGGIEDAVTPKLSVKVEYLYTDLGSSTATNADISAAFPGTMITTNTTFSTLRVGVNWKLN